MGVKNPPSLDVIKRAWLNQINFSIYASKN